MIQRAFITQWGKVAPWRSLRQVEQDLIICRALVSIYQDAFLAEHLAFRGGTALHKLYLQPQPRYSEDIDLVQVQAEPIRETIDHLRDALAWLGEPVVKQKKHNNTLVFKVQPTDVGAGDDGIRPVSAVCGQSRANVQGVCAEHGWQDAGC